MDAQLGADQVFDVDSDRLRRVRKKTPRPPKRRYKTAKKKIKERRWKIVSL
jgi:hypothetical protein